MRTALFLLAGLLLMGSALILTKLFGDDIPALRTWFPGAAIVSWLAITSSNMYVGVSRAGYSVKEELPIFLLLFAVPTVVVLLARRWIG
jgi:hypothetical protein